MNAMTKKTIQEIEKTLRLHINFNGVPSGNKYLKLMDRLSYSYEGTPSIRLSSLLNDYFKIINVSDLDEALERLHKIDVTKK